MTDKVKFKAFPAAFKLAAIKRLEAGENFERLETRTAKRVLEFHDARRNARTVASPSIVPNASADLEALVG
jgi:hypothetical protein